MRIYAGQVEDAPLERLRCTLLIRRVYQGQGFVEVRRGSQRWMVPKVELTTEDLRRLARSRRRPWPVVLRWTTGVYPLGLFVTLAVTGLIILFAPERAAWLGVASAAIAIFHSFAIVGNSVLRGHPR